MRFLFTAILFGFAWSAFAQNFPLEGNVFTDDKSPLVYSSVVLLNPADSTMQAFGITNKEGHFEIKNIKKGDYLLQIAFLGFETFYSEISIPVNENKFGDVVMISKPMDVDEVKVVGEYVPLAIRNDTVEYNSAAFKLKPDAVTEDLLKKLPGIEVDRAGNIKAMGEDVKKLFVDGKEFFGNDPKVATKNVPADAVDKVQVYNRKSEEAMFTGIDDGSREKAINLQLKEDKKNALFGDVMAGGGTEEHWQGSAKAYRFTDKIQAAALGTANNINQFGFSFNDYMNFNGGIGSIMHGSGSAQIKITTDGSFPINFGQPVSGLNTSGAGGANFSYSDSPNNRIFLSYLGSGTKKDLEEATKTWNYTDSENYLQNQLLNETDKNQSHSVNFGVRKRIDSTQNIVVDGNFMLGNSENDRLSMLESSLNNDLINTLHNQSSNNSERFNGAVKAAYSKVLNKEKLNLSAGGDLSMSTSLVKNLINTQTTLFENDIFLFQNIYQDNETDNVLYSAFVSLTKNMGKGFYITPLLKAGVLNESLFRTDGDIPGNEFKLYIPDENDFVKRYNWFRPEISFKKTNTKRTLSFTLQFEKGQLENSLNDVNENSKNYFYFVPSFMYQYEFQTGRRLMFYYQSSVNTPGISQLLPVVNEINPLAVYQGNPDLDPEKKHNFNLHWIIFDQFSFTSFMASVNGSVTNNKINWDRTINEDLSMLNTLTNVDSDYEMRGNIDFSTPLRKLGMKINFNLEEGWNKGLNFVNNIENEYTNFSHRASVSVDNRKKEKWDVNTGVEFSLTNSKYSVQKTLDNQFVDLSWFGEVRFTPNNNWNFEVNGDVTNYTDKSFGESVNIPLLGAEISHFFLKNNRGTLSLRGFDLLNKNTIVQRFSELNYLREIRSNSIGRFVMLSFTYRLNKFGGQSNGIEVKMKR